MAKGVDGGSRMMVSNQITFLEPEELNQELHKVFKPGKKGRL